MDGMKNLFIQPVRVVAVGVETFTDDLRAQGVPVVQMSWVAPTEQEKDNRELASRLAALLGR